ncbi:hypothetical protein LINPERPRIM_LOCUS3416 [Linum perenne]
MLGQERLLKKGGHRNRHRRVSRWILLWREHPLRPQRRRIRPYGRCRRSRHAPQQRRTPRRLPTVQ